MIKLTYKELLEATSSGAYWRFAAIPKSITAGHKNRKMPAAISAELKLFSTQRDDILKKYGGTINKAQTDYEWPDEEKTAAGKKALDELLAQEVNDLPGEIIKVADLLEGGLLESDYDRLTKFLQD